MSPLQFIVLGLAFLDVPSAVAVQPAPVPEDGGTVLPSQRLPAASCTEMHVISLKEFACHVLIELLEVFEVAEMTNLEFSGVLLVRQLPNGSQGRDVQGGISMV